jgi:uncharacterized protein (TIGR02466 family)
LGIRNTQLQGNMEIRVPRPVLLTTYEERAMLEKVPRDKRTDDHCLRLATLMHGHDDFDAALAELDRVSNKKENFLALYLVGRCHLDKKNMEDNFHALEAFATAAECTPDKRQRAEMIANYGLAARRMGNIGQARGAFERALSIDPGCWRALQGLCNIDFEAGDAKQVLDRVDGLLRLGVTHAAALALCTHALARLGRAADARASLGLDQFLEDMRIKPPEPWPSIEAFNEALVDEIRANPAARRSYVGQVGRASVESLRVEELAIKRAKVAQALFSRLAKSAYKYIRHLEGADHPFAKFPASAEMNAWSITAPAQGHQSWHAHFRGWISGVYYAAIPNSVSRSAGHAGCIEFGLPEDPLIESSVTAACRRLVEPTAGMLLLFPSNIYHRTYPHGAEADRVVVAFDLIPRN